MSAPKALPDNTKDEFWAVVEGCLREFHEMKQDAIRRKAGKLRTTIEGMTPAEIEFFYHSEPFDVACDIADNSLTVESYLDRYLQIRDERHDSGASKQMAPK